MTKENLIEGLAAIAGELGWTMTRLRAVMGANPDFPVVKINGTETYVTHRVSLDWWLQQQTRHPVERQRRPIEPPDLQGIVGRELSRVKDVSKKVKSRSKDVPDM